ncbi:uncharacterized protein [Bemisia tabaci]
MDTGELDVLPNNWILVGEGKSYYPVGNRTLVNKFAKTCEDPHVNRNLELGGVEWDLVEIEILKEDIDDFTKAMKDAIRATQGKRPSAESEKDVGRGKRLKKVKKLFSSESDRESSSAEGRKEPISSKRLKKVQKLTSSESEDCESLLTEGKMQHKQPTSSKKMQKPIPPIKPSSVPTIPTCFLAPKHKKPESAPKSPEVPQSFEESTSIQSTEESTPKRPSSSKSRKCRQRQKKHKCAVLNPITIEELAHAQCMLSREFQKLKEMLQKSMSEIMDRLDELLRNSQETSQSDDDESKAKIQELLKDAPFKTKEAFNSFDKTLSETSDLVAGLVLHFNNIIQSQNKLSHAARTIVRQVLSEELQKESSWMGLTSDKEGELKLGFGRSVFCNSVLMKTLKRSKKWKNDNIETLVKDTISNMLTMSQSLKKKPSAAKAKPK